MVSPRSLWLGVALVVAVLAIGILVGGVFGDAGLAVESVTVEGHTPTNASTNCEDVVVRQVTVSVTLERAGPGLDNPQPWDAGVSVRASALQQTKSRHVTVAPGETATASIPFTSVRDDPSAPLERVDAVVRVTHGNSVIDERTVGATLQPVKAGESC